MEKECPHDNVKRHGIMQCQKLVIQGGKAELEDVLGKTVEIEECLDCGEIRKEYYQQDIDAQKLRNSEEFRQHSYIVREEYYTNGGHLVERDWSDNWYWNGHKMSKKELDARMLAMGDKMGRQDVSDQFKEIVKIARNKSEEMTHKKKVAVENLRDALK